MAHTPADSRVKVTPQLEEQLANASTEQIRELMAQAAIDQGLVVRDHYSPDVLLEVEPAATPRRFGRTVEINGVKTIIEGESEHDLDKQAIELYRAAQNPASKTPTPQPQTQPRTDDGRFAKQQQDDAVRRSELDLKFRRGEIAVDQYIAESGALDRYLDAKGVSVAALVEATNQRYTQSWASATDEFLASPKSAGWPGGQENLKLIGDKMVELGLQDAEDKVGAIVTAFEALKAEDALVPTPGQELARELSEATTFSDVARLAKEFQGR